MTTQTGPQRSPKGQLNSRSGLVVTGAAGLDGLGGQRCLARPRWNRNHHVTAATVLTRIQSEKCDSYPGRERKVPRCPVSACEVLGPSGMAPGGPVNTDWWTGRAMRTLSHQRGHPLRRSCPATPSLPSPSLSLIHARALSLSRALSLPPSVPHIERGPSTEVGQGNERRTPRRAP